MKIKSIGPSGTSARVAGVVDIVAEGCKSLDTDGKEIGPAQLAHASKYNVCCFSLTVLLTPPAVSTRPVFFCDNCLFHVVISSQGKSRS